MAEFNKTGTINLVICTYFNSTKVAKQQISDLATILGTVVGIVKGGVLVEISGVLGR